MRRGGPRASREDAGPWSGRGASRPPGAVQRSGAESRRQPSEEIEPCPRDPSPQPWGGGGLGSGREGRAATLPSACPRLRDSPRSCCRMLGLSEDASPPCSRPTSGLPPTPSLAGVEEERRGKGGRRPRAVSSPAAPLPQPENRRGASQRPPRPLPSARREVLPGGRRAAWPSASSRSSSRGRGRGRRSGARRPGPRMVPPAQPLRCLSPADPARRFASFLRLPRLARRRRCLPGQGEVERPGGRAGGRGGRRAGEAAARGGRARLARPAGSSAPDAPPLQPRPPGPRADSLSFQRFRPLALPPEALAGPGGSWEWDKKEAIAPQSMCRVPSAQERGLLFSLSP